VCNLYEQVIEIRAKAVAWFRLQSWIHIYNHSFSGGNWISWYFG